MLLAWMLPVGATTLRIDVERIETGLAVADGVSAVLDWDPAQQRGALRLSAAAVVVEDFDFRYSSLEWQCQLQRSGARDFICEGPVAAAAGPILAGPAASRLRLHVEGSGLTARLDQGPAALELGAPGGEGDLLLALERAPVAWLRTLTASVWAQGRLQSGEVDARLRIATADSARTAVRGRFELHGIGLDTPDGLLAAEGLDARGGIDVLRHREGTDLQLELELLGGELLAGSLYVPLPEAPVAVSVQAGQRAGAWRVPRLVWDDGEVLQLQGELALDAGGAIDTLSLTARSSGLATLSSRYLSGFLAPAGLGQMQLSGAIQGQVRMQQGRLVDAGLNLERVNAIDGAGRFSFAGLDGHPRWVGGAAAVASTLEWSAGAIYGLGLGPASLPLHSAHGRIGLDRPVGMALLGGRLEFDHLELVPAVADEPLRISLGMALADLDLGDLSQRLGWPPFTGTVEGRIPSAVYRNDQLVLDGGLSMQLFDGILRIGALSMERPFGVAPTLSADVDFAGIELQPLTAAFGFGEIIGQLAGSVHGLRLLDWSPVAFNARLYSDPAYRGRQRISQRAVQDISSVGGNLLLSSLQNQALRLFSSFRYSRIAIGCRLADEVCLMDGIRSHGDGYTIIEGAGLPHLTVVGFRRRVDWPVLVERLHAASEGQTPIID